jgi:Histidine kinase
VLQGLGTALILAIVAQVRNNQEQRRAAISAEVRALQARMNPHFLFNALNALAAPSTIAPREIPPGRVGYAFCCAPVSTNTNERWFCWRKSWLWFGHI